MLSKHEVIELVKRHVDRNQPRDYKLVVWDESIRFVSEGLQAPLEYFQVVVQPDPTISGCLEYGHRLGEIEGQIQRETDTPISLLPAMPD